MRVGSHGPHRKALRQPRTLPGSVAPAKSGRAEGHPDCGAQAMSLYLVTGGCGFIGSHLAEALISAGERVRVLDDLSTGTRDHLAPSATLIVGDVRDPETVARALEDVDGCFHLAPVASVT